METNKNTPLYTEKSDLSSQQAYIREVMRITQESAVARPMEFTIKTALDEILNNQNGVFCKAENKYWICPVCGCNSNDGNFCKNCGKKH